jgi:two-component system, NarL family, sensor histidine kinase UhpB
LLRIAQESIANAVRHGRARKIDVFLDTNAKQEAVMVVIDDGVRSPDAPSGLGMVGMTERAVILGGTFSSSLRESGGTRVEVRVPAQRLE